MNIGFNGELVPHTGSRAANVTAQRVDPSMLADIAKAQPNYGSLWKDIANFGKAVFQMSEQMQEADFRVDSMKMQEDYQHQLSSLSQDLTARQLNGEFDNPTEYFNAYEKGLTQIRTNVTNAAYGTADGSVKGYFRNKDINKPRYDRMIESLQENSWRQGMAQYEQMLVQRADTDIKYREKALKNMFASWENDDGNAVIEEAGSIGKDNYRVPDKWKPAYVAELVAQSYSDYINASAQKQFEQLFSEEVYNDIKNTYLTLGSEEADKAISAYISQADAVIGLANARFEKWSHPEELTLSEVVAKNGTSTITKQRSTTKSTLNRVRTDLVSFLSTAKKEGEDKARGELEEFATGKKTLAELGPTAHELALLANPELTVLAQVQEAQTTQEEATSPAMTGEGLELLGVSAGKTKASAGKAKVSADETEVSPDVASALAFGASEDVANKIQNGEMSLSDFVNSQINGFVDQELVPHIPDWLTPRLTPYKLENGAVTYSREELRESLLTQLIYDINANAYSEGRLNEYRSTLLTGRLFLNRAQYTELANAFLTHMRGGKGSIPKGAKEAELNRAKLTLYHLYNPNDDPDKESLDKFFKGQCGEAQLQALNALALNTENCGSVEEMRSLFDRGIEDISRIASAENAFTNIMAYADSIRFYTSDYAPSTVAQMEKRDNTAFYLEHVEPLFGLQKDAIKKAMEGMSDEELTKINKLLRDPNLGGVKSLDGASDEKRQLFEEVLRATTDQEILRRVEEQAEENYKSGFQEAQPRIREGARRKRAWSADENKASKLRKERLKMPPDAWQQYLLGQRTAKEVTTFDDSYKKWAEELEEDGRDE